MKAFPFFSTGTRRLACIALLTALATAPAFAAATLRQQIDPPEASVGDQVTISYTLQNGNNVNFNLPPVDGLQVAGAGTQSQIAINNMTVTSSFVKTFIVVPTKPGNLTIPAFDITMPDGQVLHTQAMKLHVVTAGTAPAPSSQFNQGAANPQIPRPYNPPFNPNGPVVMPPGAPQGQPDDTATSSSNLSVPMDKDGRPAKVFMIATPKTTDAYVGETIPMRIEFYIRMDVNAQQDSLPTIIGSDFLMNNLSTRPGEDEVVLMNEPYQRDTWVTAISAPKSGDFPFQMKRDTYWAKSTGNGMNDPWGGLFFNRPQLMHQPIGSNQMTFHVHSLPEDKKPANFSGAIGDLKVTGTAEPSAVSVGEPVTLHFEVSGEGNFDYVKCPTLTADPAWKSYTPTAKTEYLDESRTQGVKRFEQAVIPQKNGRLALPDASFSYFNPTTKQYVTVPIHLPAIEVNGNAPTVASTAPAAGPDDAVAPDAPEPKANDLLPNRLELGTLHPRFNPVYRQSWFLALQGGLALLVLAAIALSLRRLRSPDTARLRTDEALRRKTIHAEEDAMTAAVRRNDATAFFLAARHAVQLHLGSQWRLKPEAITLAEIRERDPSLASALEPLFQQADEVIYSGGAGTNLNLAEWEQRVRREYLQLQPVHS